MNKFLFKTYLFAGAVAVLASCSNSQKTAANKEIRTDTDGMMLVGRQSQDQLQKPSYAQWYNPEYDRYNIDTKTVEELKKNNLRNYDIIAFMGTWCSDSHREVPRFMKIMEAADYPQNKIDLIGVNRNMKSPDGEEIPYQIKNVPTFIVMKNGKEIGRIVEYPESGYMERDLLKIIQK